MSSEAKDAKRKETEAQSEIENVTEETSRVRMETGQGTTNFSQKWINGAIPLPRRRIVRRKLRTKDLPCRNWHRNGTICLQGEVMQNQDRNHKEEEVRWID